MPKDILALVNLSTRLPQFFTALASINTDIPLKLSGVSGSLNALLFATHAVETGTPVLFVAKNQEGAESIASDFRQLLGEQSVAHFAGETKHRYNSAHQENVEDVAAIKSLLSDKPHIVVTHAAAVGQRLPGYSDLQGKILTIAHGEECGFANLLEILHGLGFEKKDFVQGPGDMAIRGGIIDVFPFVGENPLRLEFLGDTVESIREFDPRSQRSIRELAEASLVANLLEKSPISDAILLEYLHDDTLIVLDAWETVNNVCELQHEESMDRFLPFSEISHRLQRFRQVHIAALTTRGSVDLSSSSQQSFNRSVKHLYAHLSDLQQQLYDIIVTSDTVSEQHRLRELLNDVAGQQDERPLDLSRITFSQQSLCTGFILPMAELAILTEHQVFDRLKRRPSRRKTHFRGFTGRDLSRLHKGDYVVHQEYGIGKFDGLKKITVNSIDQEVLKLLYEDNDTLYVNLNYVGRLQKYSSKEGHVPKLTKLGRPDWEKLKARAKNRIKNIARDLMRLYAQRKESPGFSCAPDTPWQKELEASFIYEDTFDQARTTLDVKQDMEAPHPMDRLVCGDVGFGKTEVAVRAAFKAVVSGKQVAVLVPTTILAMQHLNTFIERTSAYSTRVAALSRFQSRKDQFRLLDELKAGSIDIIIGTHRLLSGDVSFKDLGLLIIDEEHRFGVAAKEKLRQLRTNVDTLTLTATPIPRTLHFSLMGARDLSIIATPPRNRLPVITEITERNDDLIKDAILREVRRGGQVYVVHDRVKTIPQLTAELQSVLPGVRVHFAHGQMAAHELEQVMIDFLGKKFDVLVCTKIIESGLDIPNVNTIIINRADRFGMAELYQLRGRAGRSNVQAYAYLLIPPVQMLPKDTLLRLQALEEFTELGSGFHLAMRDLEIRGAGNLLGSEQSGFIESMGFETYTRILDETIRELKDEEFGDLFKGEQHVGQSDNNVVVEVEFNALLPEAYVPSDNERLDIYRRLYSVTTFEQLDEIGRELRDRFGQFTEEVTNLLGVVRLRLAAGKAGFKKVHLGIASVEFELPPESDRRFYDSEPFQFMMARIGSMKQKGIQLRTVTSRLIVFSPLPKADSVEFSVEHTLTLIVDLTGISVPQSESIQ